MWRVAGFFRHCERSEAIQKCRTAGRLDCFVRFAPRNDGMIVGSGRAFAKKRL
jgi:hypothetical protein